MVLKDHKQKMALSHALNIDEATHVRAMIDALDWDDHHAQHIDDFALSLVQAIRSQNSALCSWRNSCKIIRSIPKRDSRL